MERRWSVILLGAGLVLGLVMSSALSPPLHPIDLLIAFAIGAVVAGAVTAVLVLRMRKAALPGAGGVAAFTLAGVMLIVASALLLSNQFLHHAAPSLHAARIVSRDHGRSGTYVQVESWVSPGAQLGVRVSSARYDQLKVGDSIELKEHPGALGWSWLSKEQ